MEKQEYNPSLFEAIDACRVDSDDLALPHMNELARQLQDNEKLRDVFERSQRLDRTLGRAFSDVPVPVGLADRLVAAVVAQEAEPSSSGETEQNTGPVQLPQKPAAKNRGLRGRRLAIGTGIAACLAVMVTYAAIKMFDKPDPITEGELFTHIDGWIADTERQGWNKDVAAAPTSQFPMDRSLRPTVQIRQWQEISTEFGDAAVYDLAPAGEKWAMLFVIQTSDDMEFDVERVLPQIPDMTTQGISVGFCHYKGKLYVLVLEDLDKQRYKSFFKELKPVA